MQQQSLERSDDEKPYRSKLPKSSRFTSVIDSSNANRNSVSNTGNIENYESKTVANRESSPIKRNIITSENNLQKRKRLWSRNNSTRQSRPNTQTGVYSNIADSESGSNQGIATRRQHMQQAAYDRPVTRAEFKSVIFLLNNGLLQIFVNDVANRKNIRELAANQNRNTSANIGVPWDQHNTTAYYERKANMQRTQSQSDSRSSHPTQWIPRIDNHQGSDLTFNELQDNTRQIKAPFDNMMFNAQQVLRVEIRATNSQNTHAESKEVRRDSRERSMM